MPLRKSNEAGARALWEQLTNSEADEAAAFLNEREQSILVSYDKEDLSFRAIALKLGEDSTRVVQKGLQEYLCDNRSCDLHLISCGRWIHSNWVFITNSSTLDNETSNSVPYNTTTSVLTSNTMAEEKPFIPMDDPRRIYKIPGTTYAMCHPGLSGSWAGYKNTPEEQRAMDEFHRANWEEVKHMRPEELRAHIEAIKKSVNEKDEADRLLTEDISRQQDELRAQREVERRVYYRQKALKEAKKKEKEERARARAIARGEIVDDGEDGAGSNGPAHTSGEGMTGIIQNGAVGGGNAGYEDGSALPQDQAAADGLGHAVDNAF